MPTYRVMWEIDIEAETKREAAEEALRIQRDPDSIATVFMVRDRVMPYETIAIDLREPEAP